MSNRIKVLVGIGVTFILIGQGIFAQEPQVVIKEEKGPTGHSTIGIDERFTGEDTGKEIRLAFSTLMTWDYDASTNPPPPKKIKSMDGRNINLVGFMYPLQQGTSIQYFCLLRTTQTCCYGPRPQYNQYVFVEMKAPTAFHRLDPVSCTGKLSVEPTPDEGFIYRMDGETCEVVSKTGKK